MKLNAIFRFCSSLLITLKVWPIRTAVVCLLFVTCGYMAFGQEQPPAAEPNYEFVSGTVTEFTADHIVVNRALLGQAPENRTFLTNAETKVEGKLKAKARVTVGFKTTDEGDVAVRIIVRASQSSKKP
jgi:hypothetical protein